MQAVILCAGKSTRTYPLTENKPKPLLKVANKSILEHNLEQLQGLVKEAILVVGFKSDLIKEKIGDSFGKILVRYVEQKTIEGTGSAILAAKEYLKDKFIVMNGDDYFSKDDIQKCLRHDYCVLGKKVEDLTRFGEIILGNKNVISIKEKPGKKPGIANTGLYVFDTKIFLFKLQKSKRGEYEIVDFIKCIAQEKKVICEYVDNFWMPITYPWNLLEANEYFLRNIKGKNYGTIEKNVAIKGNVIIGKNTLVKSGSYIEGNVVIGDNCIVGPNCYIRGKTTVGNNSKIGNAVEVKNCLIGENTSIGHLSYIGDSVIGNNVNLGAGTITANLRHDNNNIKSFVKEDLVDSGRRKLGCIIGDGVHTGINTSIYPGRKIWTNKETLPGEIIRKDVR